MLTPDQECKLARRALELRESGCSLAYIWKRAAVIHVALMTLAAALAALAFMLRHGGVRAMAVWGVGLACGAVLRDVGWFRAVRKSWPYTAKVTNWETVRELAAEPTHPPQ